MEETGSLGTSYKDGEFILRQGEAAENMFVVQEGRVEILREENGVEIPLCVCDRGHFVGLSALFHSGIHQASVRASGPARLITIHRKNLLRRIHEDPSLSLHIIELLSSRFHKLTDHITELTLTREK